MKTVHKAVAAVVSDATTEPHLLVFDHPTAGTQLVKGTVEDGETIASAVIRELFEESGLVVDSAGFHVGDWERTVGGGPDEMGPIEINTWHLFIVPDPGRYPTSWQHEASGSPAEDGLVFAFRWIPINEHLNEALHPLFEPVTRMILEHFNA